MQDSTARECAEDEEWRDNLASVGLHFLSLAMHQCIITADDLQRLEVGKPFKLSHLVARRTPGHGGPAPAEVDSMCVQPPHKHLKSGCRESLPAYTCMLSAGQSCMTGMHMYAVASACMGLALGQTCVHASTLPV